MNGLQHHCKLLIQLLITTFLLVFAASSTMLAQQVTLAVGSGSASPGTSVTVPITMTTSGGSVPAGVQWTMGYSSSDISSVSVVAGASSTAAGKSVNCSSTSTSTICVAYGMNENIIASGTVASATITIASGALDTSAPIQISGVMGTVLTGSTSIATSGTGGIITIPQPTQPTLSGLSCAPATVNAGGVSACTVTLSSAALAGGFVVGVTSNNTNAAVPASVTVAAGAASVGFSATASASVATTQTAVLTASVGGVSKTFSLNLVAAGTWTISGSVGAAGSSATLTLTGASTATTTANASGNYTFSGLANGSYTVTPTKSGFTFSPASVTVAVNGANATAGTFTETPIAGLVQTAASLGDTAATSISQAFASANAAGNLIAVTISWGTNTATPTVTDTKGNTYALATTGYSPAGDQSLAIYYAKNIAGGVNTVTVNFGGAHSWRRILVAELSGIDPINPVDSTATNSGTATTAANNVTSNASTTTATGDLIFGAVENYNIDGTLSSGSGFTLVNSLTSGSFIETAIEVETQSSPGSIASTFTFAHADGYLAQMIAFRSAAGMPPTT